MCDILGARESTKYSPCQHSCLSMDSDGPFYQHTFSILYNGELRAL